MKIIVESHVPYLRGVFDDVADVRYLPSEEITPEKVIDADALIVRTRNRCDETLLNGSKCKIIATATIGTDHIDIDFCNKNGIEVINAPGCNAAAVAQYVLCSLIKVAGTELKDKTLGIVGVGHVGSIVDRWARSIGMKTMLNDPPRQEKEGDNQFTDLETIAQNADFITFHVPSTKTGPHPTYHLADKTFFDRLEKCKAIINSSRGAVVDNGAWVMAINSGKAPIAIVDCWENEPDISHQLLEKAAVATPHIAGYSDAGKRRASRTVIEAVAKKLNLKPNIPGELLDIPDIPETVTIESLWQSYNPTDDTRDLKSDPLSFENLRNNYKLRVEPKGEKRLGKTVIVGGRGFIGDFTSHYLGKKSESIFHIELSEKKTVNDVDLAVWIPAENSRTSPDELRSFINRLAPRKITMISSCGIYAEKSGENLNELTPLNPDSPYFINEETIKEICSGEQIPLTILRLPEAVVGTGMTGILRKIVNSIFRGTFNHIKGNTTRVSTLHASSVGEAIFATLSLPGIFNLNDNSNPTVDQLTDALSYRIGKKIFTITPSNAKKWNTVMSFFGKNNRAIYEFQTTNLTFSAAKFIAATGFTPVSVVEYLKNHVYDENSL